MEKAPIEVLSGMMDEPEPPYDSLSTDFGSLDEVETHYELLRCQTSALDSARYWYPNAGGKKIGLLFERKPHLSNQLGRENISDHLLKHLEDLRRASVNFFKLRAVDCCIDERGIITWRFLPSRDGCWYSDEVVRQTRDRLLEDAWRLEESGRGDTIVFLSILISVTNTH
ncbi:hypothetical protein GP486_004058 [Trichoglossum hirsutum]|uniref:Uncharacterized protein n=1 Tax=Trichoglossum hirsutum TaxID=265104 RepID=A0A9P8RPS3_9PEZI|nr:hypothetical protein GP486_004058 [Trichoglossum hirsutum]